MRRLVLFAIGLVCLAIGIAIAFTIFNKADRTPTPTSSQLPASAATAVPTEVVPPVTDQTATLLAAFEQTSALSSLEADLVMISSMPPSSADSMDLSMSTHSLLTFSEAGLQQHSEMSSTMGLNTMDMILLGSTGYTSSTIFSEDSDSTEWQILPSEQAAAMSAANMWPTMLARMLDPEHDLPLLTLEGHEELNGIACDRYFTDKAAMPWAAGMQNLGMSFTQQDLSVWHCADGNIRRLEANAAVGNPKYPDFTNTATMRLNLIATSTTRVITAPANARPMKR